MKLRSLVVAAVLAGALVEYGSGHAAAAGSHASTAPPAPPPASSSLASYQSCVISAESSGDAQVWNKQGYPYWGLYQFGRPLWEEYGGSSASWGHAPAATQTQIFYNVMAHYKGCMNWYPSDGCTDPGNGCD